MTESRAHLLADSPVARGCRCHRVLATGTLVLAVIVAAVPQAFAADVFPTKAITLVVPFPPGGINDALARELKQQLETPLGQSVVIENRPGASAMLGANLVKNAPADGHTLLLTTASSMTTAILLSKNPPYKPTDFEPVAMLGKQAVVFSMTKAIGAANLGDLVRLGKERKGDLTFGVIGTGTIVDLLARSAFAELGVEARSIPYKGTQEAAIDAIAGRIWVMTDSPTTAAELHKSGRLKAFAVTSDARLPSLPDVPSFAELGHPAINGTIWFAVFAPKGTPKPVVERLNAVINQAMGSPPMRAFMERSAVLPGGGSAPEVANFVRSDYERWGKVIKDNQIPQVD